MSVSQECTYLENCFIVCRWVELQDGLDARKKELNDAIRLQQFYVETTETKVSIPYLRLKQPLI